LCICSSSIGVWLFAPDINGDLCLFAGASMKDMKLDQAECYPDERIYWFGSFVIFWNVSKNNIMEAHV
jgi:hypothetical protein